MLIIIAITATSVANPWKFAVLSDINYDNGRDVAGSTLEFLVQDIRNQKVDLVIFAGDMIDGSDMDVGDYKKRTDTWKPMMKPLYDVGIPIYVIRGDNEAESIISANSDLWLNKFPVLKI